MSKAADSKARQAKFRANRNAQGLKRISDQYAHPDDHAAIKKYIEKANKKRLKQEAQTKG